MGQAGRGLVRGGRGKPPSQKKLWQAVTHAHIRTHTYIYICIHISEVEGKKRSPRNREIGFVSFVRAGEAKLREGAGDVFGL